MSCVGERVTAGLRWPSPGYRQPSAARAARVNATHKSRSSPASHRRRRQSQCPRLHIGPDRGDLTTVRPPPRTAPPHSPAEMCPLRRHAAHRRVAGMTGGNTGVADPVGRRQPDARTSGKVCCAARLMTLEGSARKARHHRGRVALRGLVSSGAGDDVDVPPSGACASRTLVPRFATVTK